MVFPFKNPVQGAWGGGAKSRINVSETTNPPAITGADGGLDAKILSLPGEGRPKSSGLGKNKAKALHCPTQKKHENQS